MKKFIQKTPFALSGVMLGYISLVNLLKLQKLFIIPLIFFIIIISLKVILFFPDFRAELGNSIMVGIFSTFPMSLMLFSVYLIPLNAILSESLWYLAIIIHCSLAIYFSIRFIPQQKIKDLYGTHFIIFVGLAIISLTAPHYNNYILGTFFFYFSLISYLILVIPITYRYFRYPKEDASLKPLVCILTAPPNLCLFTYLKSIENIEVSLIIILTALSLFFYILVLLKLPFLLFKKKFYPSYASFTFPFVISATSTHELCNYLEGTSYFHYSIEYICLFQTILAILLVGYTLIRYLNCMVLNLVKLDNKTKKAIL